MNKDKSKLSLLLLSIVLMIIVICVVDTKASAGTVTGYEKVTWGISSGRYYVNEIHAFCAQYNKSWPTVGTVVTEIVPCTNDVLRKALYYGYNGPQNTLGTDDKAHVLTAIAVSDANIGETVTGASATYDAFYWELVNNSEKYPSPPSSFKVYIAITASDEMQNLAFYVMEKNGYVQGNKTSTDVKLNDGNPCYSLAEAQYGIYTLETLEESSKVGTLTTNADGSTNVLELNAGTYYAYENVAPRGYAKSEQVVSFTVTAEQTTTLYFEDIPQTNAIDILLEKVDAESKQNKPQGDASLAGAEFTVHYYAGIWQEDIDPASLGETPRRTWVFETDKNGLVRYESQYQVSGDELYASMPLGTLVIQETKASEGYLKNDTVYVKQITAAGTGVHVSTYVHPIVPEKTIEVRVKKYQTDTEEIIPGTIFEHTAPDGKRSMVVTDEKGEIVLNGLQYGVHTLWEVSVMDGYSITNPIHTFVVDENTNGHIELVIYNNPSSYNLNICKSDNYANKLSNAEFAIYEDAECTKELSRGNTDENGMLQLCNLAVGKKYYLKEIKAPAGYEIQKDENGEQHIYEIYAISTPIKDEFLCYVDGKLHDNVTGTKAHREVNMEIKNDVGYMLPKTGSCATALMNLSGITLCSMSLYLNSRKKKQEKGEKKL